jgi:hypothetical protein
MIGIGHLVWIAIAAVLGFAAPFVFDDLLALPVDLYYFVYFAVVIAFFCVYIKLTKLRVREWCSKRLIWGVLLGLAFGALMVQNVLSRPETEKLTGAYLAWSIFWRGAVYGTIDGLFLSSFPWTVTWRAFDANSKPLGKKIAFAVLAWVMILVVTTAYHLGYPDFRSRKILQPNLGLTIMSIPTLFSANPIGAPITHAIMHITATMHSPKTELFLPPHRD